MVAASAALGSDILLVIAQVLVGVFAKLDGERGIYKYTDPSLALIGGKEHKGFVCNRSYGNTRLFWNVLCCPPNGVTYR